MKYSFVSDRDKYRCFPGVIPKKGVWVGGGRGVPNKNRGSNPKPLAEILPYVTDSSKSDLLTILLVLLCHTCITSTVWL